MAKWAQTVGVEREGFSIKVPEGWWEFDIRPDTRDNAIRRMVDERVRAMPELESRRDGVISFLRKQAREAWDAGAAYIGCMAEDFGGGSPVTATMTVSLIRSRGSDGQALSNAPADVITRLKPVVARRDGDPWREVSTVEIPGLGQVARTKGVEDLEYRGDARRLRMVMMQTFIPAPGTGGKLALVTGSSPVLDLAEAFFDVFDAVTSTFRFV
jgi:hypothetical protein